ncbi:MAG: Gfo/Idh/MocA family protein [Acidobacteriota bacterium]
MLSRRGILACPPFLLAQSTFRLAILGSEHGHVTRFAKDARSRPGVEVLGPLAWEDRSQLASLRPDAVACFTSTDRHLEAVRLCTSLRLPTMMEKPLAISNDHARQIAALARSTGTAVFVNFETTWYPSHAALWQFFKQDNQAAGRIRKMVAMDGHAGPKEIGVGPEFLSWLTDPARNGAGALFDFGCYGANLMTWLMDNARPVRVTAATKQNKPEIYSRVDDEATILVDYPGAQGIIQASWNWPFSRKDFEVYGETAYAHAYGASSLRRRRAGEVSEQRVSPPDLPAEQADSLSYLMAIARGKLKPSGLSSLENNLIATEILVAARESARSGRSVSLKA